MGKAIIILCEADQSHILEQLEVFYNFKIGEK
jgi:hypothetical protein